MSNLIKKQENNIIKGVERKETVKKELDTGLIFRKILYGATKVELDINYMKELFNFQFLTEDERKLLREYIELAEKLNCNKISEKVLKLKDNYFKDIFEELHFAKNDILIKYKNEENKESEYFESEIVQLINLFIIERKKEMAAQQIAIRVQKGGFIQEDIANIINSTLNEQRIINKSESINNFQEIYEKDANKINYKTGINYIDQYTKGYRQGIVTAIIGNDITFNTLWATNGVYETIKLKKNVCYISTNANNTDIISQFVLKHFQKMFPVESEKNNLLDIKNHTILEEEKFWNAYKDFKENWQKYLKVITDEDIKFNSISSFRATLFEMDRLLKMETGKGIELLIIDGIENMPFEKNWVQIQNNNIILANYMNELKKESKNFLNNNKEIAIMVTSSINNMNSKKGIENRFSININSMNKNIEKYSDTIISIYNAKEYWYTADRDYFNIFINKNKDYYLPDTAVSMFVDLKKMQWNQI